MSNVDSRIEFKNKLGSMPMLPAGPGDYEHVVRSHWIEGVFYEPDDRQDPNSVIVLQRLANNEAGYGPHLDYAVVMEWTRNQLRFTPETAMNLGWYLIQAGSAATLDLAEHAHWLAHGHSKRGE